jgi:16S rRNA G966 N2-methylase RsmD
MKELKELFDRLGMNDQNGLYITAEKKWKGKLSARVEWLLEDKIEPEAFFCIDNKPIVLFYNSPQNKEELFKAIWNFNESPVVIVNESNTVEIFNGLSYLKDKKTLEKLEDDNKINAFSYFELVTGKTWQTYENKLKYQNRVDYKLLENIRDTRDLLINNYKIDGSLSNALIGKCIFIRYLIDRNVRINFNDGNLRERTNDEFCSLLENKDQTIQFLNYLREHFNGEAFLLKDTHLQNIPKEAFDVLSRLMRGVEIATGQLSLFDIYDFSIIPVEFISNVYEHFIGSENQAKKGAYYTPLFLVDYIVTETVEKYLNENPEKYNCKVLDPACGSGIFLVESLRRMIEQCQKINSASKDIESFKNILRSIAEENIYGIDQDENAINVAIFSVYLALLDYLMDPKDIENFKFPALLNKNFFTSDFFDLNADFNGIIKEINFDFILGNPPWKRGADGNSLFLKYVKERKQRELSKADGKPLPTISNKEIAQAFLLRTSDVSTTQTRCALIVTSKTLYNLNAEDFRRYFLHNYFFDKVFELAPVRKEVFDRSNDPSVGPAAILFFHYAHGEVTDKNIIEHIALKPNRFFSLFKLFMLQKNDYKKVVQSRLKKDDWLWKTLVYGSYLDFNLIKRLKTEYKTIGDIIKENGYLTGQGIQYGQDRNNARELSGMPIVDVKYVQPYFIEPHTLNIFSEPYVHRIRNKQLFEENKLIIKKGISHDFKLTSAISYEKAVFKDSLTAIKVNQSSEVEELKIFCGLLNSILFSYFITQTGTSIGVEREQVFDKEKFSFPYINSATIANYVERIEKISKELFNEKKELFNQQKIQALENEKEKFINNLDDEILNSFNLNEQEKALADYAVNITIPLIMKHKGYEKELPQPLKIKDPFLTNYAKVFLNRFQNSFEKSGKKFTLQILCSNYIIGMFFRVANEPDNKGPISWQETSEGDLLTKLSSLGYQKITKSLFIQKDIRGFEKDGFYIAKPNEKKLWHKAIAYLDAEEFADAMLREGSKEKQNDKYA